MSEGLQPAFDEDRLVGRIRERANRILGQNASNTAKALAKDALELCEAVERMTRSNLGLGRPLHYDPSKVKTW